MEYADQEDGKAERSTDGLGLSILESIDGNCGSHGGDQAFGFAVDHGRGSKLMI